MFSPKGLSFWNFAASVNEPESADQNSSGPQTTRTVYPSALAFSLDSKQLAVAIDGRVQVWSLDPIEKLATLRGDSGDICVLEWAPDGTHLAYISAHNTVHVYDAKNWKQVHVLYGLTKGVTYLRFSSDSRCLLTAEEFGPNRYQYWLLHVAADQHIAVEQEKGMTISQINARLGGMELKKVRLLGGSDDGPTAQDPAYLHHLGREIILSSGSTTFQLGPCLGVEGPTTVFAGHTDEVTDARFSPDGRYIASASTDGTVRLWQPGTGQHLHIFQNDRYGHEEFNGEKNEDGRPPLWARRPALASVVPDILAAIEEKRWT